MALEEALVFSAQTENTSAFNFSHPHPAEHTMWCSGVIIAAVYALVILIGLVGNITLIKTFCTVKSMRNMPKLFMSSLALGDLLLIVTCAPVDASRYLADEWLFGRVGCKLIPFIQYTSVGVSVFTLTALSADRYRAIIRPMAKGPSNATAAVCIRAAAIWLFSMTLATPEFVFSDLHMFNVAHANGTFVTCAPYPHTGTLHPRVHSTVSFLVLYVIPLSIISVYYALIARGLCNSGSSLPVEAQRQLRKQVEVRKRLARTVLVFVALFAVCWLPTHVIYLYRSYHYTEVDTSLAHYVSSIFARLLAFTNSCVNPFALYLLSRSFRKQFNRQLCCGHTPTTPRVYSTVQSNTHVTLVKNRNPSLVSFSLND